MSEETLQPTPVKVPRASSWWRVLLMALGLYFLGIALLVLTGNPNLFPTVVIVGSFMVPVAYVFFFYERRQLSQVTMPTTTMTFFYGGLLGVFAASILEPLLIHGQTLPAAFVVGLVEEFVKILGVLVIARRRRHDSELDGLVLGAAAGMGFAAFESVGYAFTAFLRSGGSLSATVVVTLVRALASPVGHGTWTAILTSILFRESDARGYHFDLKVLGAYLLVVILHGLWDGIPIVISELPLPGLDVFIGQLVVGVLSLFILGLRWREARRLQLARSEASPEA